MLFNEFLYFILFYLVFLLNFYWFLDLLPAAYFFPYIQSLFLVLNLRFFLLLFFFHNYWIRFLLWSYTLHKLLSWIYVQSFDYTLYCHQICFQLSKVQSFSATMTIFCRSAINISHLSIPGLLFSLHPGCSCWFFSQCVSCCLCLYFSSFGNCAKTHCMILSVLISGSNNLLSSHHKEYFIARKCVWVPVSLQMEKAEYL